MQVILGIYSFTLEKVWSPGRDLSPRPTAYEALGGGAAFGGGLPQIDWQGFRRWLAMDYRPGVAKCWFNYARKFSYCLVNRDFSEIKSFGDGKKRCTLNGLAALSKFLGIHGEFKLLVQNYGLMWAGKSADELVIDRLTKVTNESEIYDWMKSAKAEVPDYADFVDLAAGTGLRYEEAVNAWNLTIDLAQKGKLSDYYKEAKQVLEHFRFKDLFIRRSKKAFISFVAKDQITKIARGRGLTTDKLRLRIKRRGLNMRFADIRELHASVLTKHLTQPEIDFIHGRVSTNVFMRNYFNPAWISDLQARTLKAADEILAKIS
jgi:hypothetical protein